jgi:hypothetical protein
MIEIKVNAFMFNSIDKFISPSIIIMIFDANVHDIFARRDTSSSDHAGIQSEGWQRNETVKIIIVDSDKMLSDALKTLYLVDLFSGKVHGTFS